MTERPTSDIAFTDAVKSAQQRLGSRDMFARLEQQGGWHASITDELASFIAARDSLYFATASADGQPYVQHRGGPKGFVKVLDPHTLAFADYSGNQQYLSVGNLSENEKAFPFLMDYVHRRRVKLWGRARFVEDDPALLSQLADPAYDATPQRVLRFTVLAWDVNCTSHIIPRHTEDDIATAMARMQAPLQQRIAELEAEVSQLRAQIAAS
ncbi:MAG: pyridoxamine 5'-phosphate oxidase family protein [Rhodospirillaceae bacterium]|nr:pyridoxamine 5'-phosphate oxidase family protein [Rhodospirillaceae bacterium]